jgi:putative endonuclease
MSSHPHRYWVYITTNKMRTVLYTGVTNNLVIRIQQHKDGAAENGKSFTSRYKCYHLVYYEEYNNIHTALEREKEIKNMLRAKKIALINAFNPEWRFLEEDF